MARYRVELCPCAVGNETEYEVEADNEALAREFAADEYLHDFASSMDFDYIVTKLED